uniref:Uncharacterized protein n=1 Tax=Oryza sativa subsp. japonica TaxID=39947 RepID=Q6YXX6_ORYSJ|nr:hypothetical protein [Oryza sativa Japonica Group]
MTPRSETRSNVTARGPRTDRPTDGRSTATGVSRPRAAGIILAVHGTYLAHMNSHDAAVALRPRRLPDHRPQWHSVTHPSLSLTLGPNHHIGV